MTTRFTFDGEPLPAGTALEIDRRCDAIDIDSSTYSTLIKWAGMPPLEYSRRYVLTMQVDGPLQLVCIADTWNDGSPCLRVL